MAAQRSMEMPAHRPIARRTAHAIGRLKGTPPTAAALHKGSAAALRIGRRMAQTRRLAPPIRIVRRGQVPVRVRLHPATATIGRLAETPRTSCHRARAPRTTATVRRTRTAAAAPLNRPPARTPRRAAATRLRRVRTLLLRVPIRRRAGAIPHLPARTPHRAALTPRLAAVMAAEVGARAAAAAEAAHAAAAEVGARTAAVVGAAAADLAAVGEAHTEAVLTDTKLAQLSPPQIGAGFFCCRISETVSPHNSSAAQVFSRVRKAGRFLIGHRGNA